MASGIFLDTHVLIWLHMGEPERLSAKAVALIESSELWTSPICLLELDYLHEIGRIQGNSQKVLRKLERELGLSQASDPFEKIIEAAHHLHWTRDPFDRLLVAQASLHSAPLVSKDKLIQRHYAHCVW